MLRIDGKNYATLADAAIELGVSAKTVRSYINRRILPQPPQVEYGLRVIDTFPPEYIQKAKAELKKHRKRGNRRGR